MNLADRLKNLPKYEKDFYSKKKNQKRLYLKDCKKNFYDVSLEPQYEMEIYDILHKYSMFPNLEYKYACRQGYQENGTPVYVKMNFQEVFKILYEEVTEHKEKYPLCSALSYNRLKKGFEAYTVFLCNATLVLAYNEQKEIVIEKTFDVCNSFEEYYKKFDEIIE